MSGVSLARPGLVIFDCDGVLVDTERITLRVMRDWVASLGWDLPIEEVSARFKGTYITLIQSVVEKQIGRAVPDFAEGYRAGMYEAFKAGVDPIPGAIAVLDALDAAWIPFCVASNGPHAKMDASLTSAGLAERLGGHKKDGGTRIFSADDVAHPKPAPDLFLLAAERMGFAPETCVVVEDSPSGIKAAVAAGMRSIGFADLTATSALREAGASVVVDDFRAVAPLLVG